MLSQSSYCCTIEKAILLQSSGFSLLTSINVSKPSISNAVEHSETHACSGAQNTEINSTADEFVCPLFILNTGPLLIASRGMVKADTHFVITFKEDGRMLHFVCPLFGESRKARRCISSFPGTMHRLAFPLVVQYPQIKHILRIK